ncbi:MAG: P-loop NTPase [Butyricicoccaceae bacterium]
MAKFIIVASGKGGTGKTSLSAGISAALAVMGKRVLVIDGDSGLRNLDIVLGMSDRVVFSFADVASGMVPLEEAAAPHPEIEGLYLLTAPSEPPLALLQNGGMSRLADQAEDFDYVIIDGPAGLAPEFRSFASVATQAIIVANTDSPSLRGAERIARMLEDEYVPRMRLVVNRIRPKLIRQGAVGTVDDAIDTTGLQLLGIVPEDVNVTVCAGNGSPIVTTHYDGAARAYTNIARRLEGEKLPLMKI